MGSRATVFLPIALIAVGAGWLLSTMGIAPDINWVWTLALAALGLLTFITSGIDKVSIVVGPLFLTASCLSVLRQSERLSLDAEVPVLVILSGVLMLVARLKSIPPPSWIDEVKVSP